MRGCLKSILCILLTTIVIPSYAETYARALKITVEMQDGMFSGASETKPNPLDLIFDPFSTETTSKKTKTVDLFPGSRTKISTFSTGDGGFGEIMVYATVKSVGKIDTEFYIDCDFEESGWGPVKSSEVHKASVELNKKVVGSYGCIGPAQSFFGYWNFPAMVASFKIENIQGKPLSDFCPGSIKAGKEFGKSEFYGGSSRNYFKTAGTLTKSTSTSCTYSGTIIQEAIVFGKKQEYPSKSVTLTLEVAYSLR